MWDGLATSVHQVCDRISLSGTSASHGHKNFCGLTCSNPVSGMAGSGRTTRGGPPPSPEDKVGLNGPLYSAKGMSERSGTP